MKVLPGTHGLALALLLTGACASIRKADTQEFVRARSQAESSVHQIKKYFRPRALEYVKTETLYGEAKAAYDCVLDAFTVAIDKGADPNDEKNLGSCVHDGQERAGDLKSFVDEALKSPRLDPATNQTRRLVDTNSDVATFVNSANQIVTFFEHVAEIATKFHERYESAVKEKRVAEIARLNKLRWRTFEEIP
jgi:hypothetical protein